MAKAPRDSERLVSQQCSICDFRVISNPFVFCAEGGK